MMSGLFVGFFLGALVLLGLGTLLGSWFHRRHREAVERERGMITVLQGAVLTLFGLLLGFSFSMANSHYDQRRKLVVDEANAISTVWLYTMTMPEQECLQEQQLLRRYLGARKAFFDAGADKERIRKSLEQASALQTQMWTIADGYATGHRDAVTNFLLSSLSQSFSLSEERTAALENHIPMTAWVMLLFMGFTATFMIGLGVQSNSLLLKLVFPFVVASALMLVLDLDHARGGTISTAQDSMERLAEQVRAVAPLQGDAPEK